MEPAPSAGLHLNLAGQNRVFSPPTSGTGPPTCGDQVDTTNSEASYNLTLRFPSTGDVVEALL